MKKKLTVGLVAGCLSAAVSIAYAASGSPAQSDSVGRQPTGTAASMSGATEATPRAAPGGGGMGSGGSMGSGASAGTGMSGSTATGAGASATAGGGGMGGDTGTSRRGRRASRG